MTEEEAKTKWCPMTYENGTARSNLDKLCLGSACMMWRECLDQVRDPTNEFPGGGVVKGGYCGLAGKP